MMRGSLLWLTVVLCAVCVLDVSNAAELAGRTRQSRSLQTKQRTSIDIKDKIIELQCYAKCGHGLELMQCHKQCTLDVMRSPRLGQCPNELNQIFKNAPAAHKLTCLDNCNFDYDCPEVQKCCVSTCGPTCMEPIGVQDEPLLPPIPKILNHKLPRSHKVELTIESSANSTYYWHVESRYHIGSLFSSRKLGTWHWQPVLKIAEVSDAKSKRTDIYFNLRPGRWYQVRVAAINGNGFRGYSKPSKAFTLKHSPKPPKPPSDLKIISKQNVGNTVSVKIAWCPAKSNLPIEKYKIIWSLYVKIRDESLITNGEYVKDTHEFEIRNLLPDSSYYIQVQAMSISGSRRLKSDKKSLLYNTTSLSPSHHEPLRCSAHNLERNLNGPMPAARTTFVTKPIAKKTDTGTNLKLTHAAVSDYIVRYRMSKHYGMVVQVSGFDADKGKIYELCNKESNCEQGGFSAVRVNKSTLEFSKLNYGSTYMLKPLQVNSVLNDASDVFTFTTPKCENVRKRFQEMQIKC